MGSSKKEERIEAKSRVFTTDELKNLKPVVLASIKIDQTKLSNQTQSVLIQSGIQYLGELNRITEHDVSKMKGIETAGLTEILEFLRLLKN